MWGWSCPPLKWCVFFANSISQILHIVRCASTALSVYISCQNFQDSRNTTHNDDDAAPEGRQCPYLLSINREFFLLLILMVLILDPLINMAYFPSTSESYYNQFVLWVGPWEYLLPFLNIVEKCVHYMYIIPGYVYTILNLSVHNTLISVHKNRYLLLVM